MSMQSVKECEKVGEHTYLYLEKLCEELLNVNKCERKIRGLKACFQGNYAKKANVKRMLNVNKC
mgnify:CR=1 FL=1